jgi:hypothetical protein
VKLICFSRTLIFSILNAFWFEESTPLIVDITPIDGSRISKIGEWEQLFGVRYADKPDSLMTALVYLYDDVCKIDFRDRGQQVIMYNCGETEVLLEKTG